MRFILSIILAVFLFSCTNKTTDAPGTASETINCYIVYSDGQAADSVNVVIIENEEALVSPENLMKDTSTTSSNGLLTFTKESTPLNLLCISNNEAIFYSGSSDFMKNIGKGGYDTIQLEIASTLEGKIISDGAPLPDRVFLKGTDLSAIVKSDSTYNFSTTPNGSFSVAGIFTGDSSIGLSSVALSSGSTTNDTATIYQKIFLLDDFDDGDSFTTVFDETGANWEDLLVPNTFISVKEDGALTNKSLEAIHLTDINNGSFTVVCPFKDSVKHDLTNCQSITFWIKGKGTMHLSLTGWRSSDTASASFTAIFPLPNEWTFKRINISDLTQDNSVTWAEASNWIQSLTLLCQWNTEDTAGYMLDEIIFNGISREEFLSE